MKEDVGNEDTILVANFIDHLLYIRLCANHGTWIISCNHTTYEVGAIIDELIKTGVYRVLIIFSSFIAVW